MNILGDTPAIHNDAGMHPRHSKVASGNYLPMEIPEGMMMPPKFMNEYLSSLERSKGVSNPGVGTNRRSTQWHQNGRIQWSIRWEKLSQNPVTLVSSLFLFSIPSTCFEWKLLFVISTNSRIQRLRNETFSSYILYTYRVSYIYLLNLNS